MKKNLLLFVLSLTIAFPVCADDFQTTMQQAMQGDPIAQRNLGVMYMNDEKYNPAIVWFCKAADQGDLEAQYRLGIMFMNGYGVSKNHTEAAKWFQQAANNGHMIAQYQLGQMYYRGEGVDNDYAQALQLFSKCAEQGYADALYMVGHMYEKGKGVSKNHQQATSWYFRAAKKGEKKAYRWIANAAEQGYVEAQCKLGIMYMNGINCSKDYSIAISWFKKAAQQGNAEAQYNLGYMLYNGYGISIDYLQAASFFHRSANKGYAEAQNYMGIIYYYGHGVAKDFSQAFNWFLKSAEQGYANAQNNVGIMYDKGEGVAKDYSKALMWYKRAIDNGCKDAEKRYKELVAQGVKVIKYESTQPPLLTLVENSLIFKDATNNNTIEANELSSIRFKVQNNGKGSAVDCETRISLSGTSNGVSVKTVKLPEIPSGQVYEVEVPITTNLLLSDGLVTFAIEVYEPHGFGVAPFNLSVATKAFVEPLLQVVDHQITSTSGQVKKMEPFTLTFNLQNTKYGYAEDVKVSIMTPENVLLMDGANQLAYSLIKSGEAQTINVTFIANNNAANEIPITIDIKEKYGRFAESKQLNIMLNQATTTNITIASSEEPQSKQEKIEIANLVSGVDRNIPQANFKNKNTFAVIIANETYQSVASVPFALNDGNIFREYCLKTLGIPEKQIKYVPNATGNQIKAQVNWLQNICEVFEDAQIIFYYAGHGIPDESSRTAYLLPVDGIGTDISTGYKLDDLYTALGNIPAKNVTVFMDACFSGSKREQGMLASARGVAIKARSGMPQGNMVVFSAAQGDETAYPNNEEKHGMFTYFLLKKLQESKGDVSLQELGEYITRNVSQQSILLNGKSQTPCVTPSASLDASWREWKLK